jgi:hypothetical protein
MATHDRQALKQLETDDDMSVSDVINQLDLHGIPVKDEFGLHRNRNSLRVTLMKDAWQAAGRSLESPGSVQQYWFENRDMLLIDFNTDA